MARRQEHHRYTAQTTVAFDPVTYQQAAGLTTYYNRHKFHALVVTHEPDIGRALSLMSCPGEWPEGALSFPTGSVALQDGPVDIRVVVDGASQQFWYRQDADWIAVGPALDASVISDEGGRGEHASFTGAFVGMIEFDLTGQGAEARFTQFDYVPAGLDP